MARKTVFKISVLLAVVAACYWILLPEMSHWNVDRFREIAGESPFKAAIVYFIIYLVAASFAVPGLAVLTMVGGAILGFWKAVLLVSFASTIGATFSFLLSRWLFRDWVSRRFDSIYEKVRGVETDGSSFLFSLRLIPLIPFSAVNLVFGITPMKTLSFYWISQLGMLPATLVYVNAGVQVGQARSFEDVMSPSVLISLSLLAAVPWLGRLLLHQINLHRIYRNYRRPPRFDYDLLIIGAGAAGLVSAYLGSALKAKVGLIERDRMGGECLHTGCVPSKSLIQSARLAHLIHRAGEFGLKVRESSVDFPSVFERIQSIISKITPKDSADRYRSLGVDCLRGEARIEDPFRVRIEDRVLTTRNIIIATGSAPFIPNIEGLDSIPYLTTDNLWDLRKSPGRLLVLGGGPVGCEMAQAFARLGVKVTLVEKENRLLNREDEEVSRLISEVFVREGIELLLGSRVARFSRAGNDFSAHLDGGRSIPFDTLLLALGRRARVKGFDELNLELSDDGTLRVDECLRTRFPNIYACGDVTGPFQYTHAASHQASTAVLNALFSPFKKFKIDYSSMPRCTYTDPEIASLGLSEFEARGLAVDYDVYKHDFADVDRAVTEGNTAGFIKVLTRKNSGKILGVTIAGPRAGDLMAEFTLAKRKNLSLNEILKTIHAYPTYGEINRLVAGDWKRSTAGATALRFLSGFHAWRRGSV